MSKTASLLTLKGSQIRDRSLRSLTDRCADRVQADECTRTGEGVVLGNLVVGVVRKECEVRTTASAAQTTGGRKVHPEVGVRRKGDKERLHPVVVADLVELLTIEGDVLS